MELKNKIILITGATKGIGLELAKQLADKNNRVIISGRNREQLDRLSKENKMFYPLFLDVSDNANLLKAREEMEMKFGKLDLLINNAAVLFSGNFYETDFSFEKIETEILTNLASPVKLTKTLLPLLSKQKEAAVVNISSAVAYMPMPSLPVYSATKAALHSFTESLRASLHKTNIKVFEALPPLVATQMTENLPGKAKSMKKISAEKCAKHLITGIEQGKAEIRIGSSKPLYWASRWIPALLRKKLNRM